MRLAGDLWLGGGADAELGDGALTYTTAAEASAEMATRGTTLDARAELSWGARWQVAARAGYHFASRDITSERPEAMLVGEQIGVGNQYDIDRFRGSGQMLCRNRGRAARRRR